MMGIAVALTLGVSARAQTDLGTAGAYNLFVTGNHSATNVDILGKVAVGGDATYTNFTIGSSQPTGSAVNTVVGGNYSNAGGTVNGSQIVGGNYSQSNPTVFGSIDANGNVTLGDGSVSGIIKHGGSADVKPYMESQLQTGTTALPINFVAEQAYLLNASQTWGALTGMAAIPEAGTNNYFLTGTDASLNIFTLSYSQLAASTTFQISAPSGSTVLVNVLGGNGTNFTLPNNGAISVSGTTLDKVLVNLPDATSINLAGSWNSSLLAPNATVTGTSGDFNGNLIARSLNGGGLELHDRLFTGHINGGGGNPIPEPGTCVLFAPGLLVLGAVLRRRK